MTAEVAGTFANGQSVGVGIRGDVLVIPSGYTSMQLTLDGSIDASNTVKTRKSTNGGQTRTDQVTYNSAQTNVAVTVAHGEAWVIETVSGQASKQIGYRMECDG